MAGGGNGPGEFNFPTHIAADRQGDLYVTDSMNSRIVRLDPEGRFKNQIGAQGDGPGHFSRPKGVAVDTFGHVYVMDAVFDNIQIFDREGQYLLALGELGSEPGQFWLPQRHRHQPPERDFCDRCLQPPGASAQIHRPAMRTGTADHVACDPLARLPLVKLYEEAFRKATGIALKLVPAGAPTSRLSLEEHENPFCALVGNRPGMRELCLKVEADLQRKVAETLAPQTTSCLAGLCLVAAPVVVSGRHVATWIGGQVLQQKPTQAAFRRVAQQLARLGLTEDLPQIQAAFFQSRRVPEEQLQASTQLLGLFAQHLGQNAERLWTVSQPEEPRSVTLAREFIQAHLTEPVSLQAVAAAAHLSPYHFCRVFRTATGMTLTDYVSRLRVERAQALLADPSIRVSEIAFQVGFGSISQFNTVFRRCLGVSPTQYRSGRRPGPS